MFFKKSGIRLPKHSSQIRYIRTCDPIFLKAKQPNSPFTRMGLVVSHIHLTTTPIDKNDFLRLEGWELDCNVSLENYSKYVTSIKDLNFTCRIVIVKNDQQLEVLEKTDWFHAGNTIKVFVGEMDDAMKKQVSKFIAEQKLDKLEALALRCEHDGVEYHEISFSEPVMVQGMYYIDIGDQRKGMSEAFYETFVDYFLWGKKEDFDLAYSCVGDEWHIQNWGQDWVNELRRNFKENFIDNYEFGKSLLVVSF